MTFIRILARRRLQRGSSFLQYLHKALEVRRQRNALKNLEVHERRDIGLFIDQVRREVERKFWDF